MAIFDIEFKPLGRKGKCGSNQSFLICARNTGVGISSICGGHGTCHSCKIQLLSGTVSEPTSSEKDFFSQAGLKEGWRLACQVYPSSDCTINVPLESLTALQRVQVEGAEITVNPEPATLAFSLELNGPSLADLKADADRLLNTLNSKYRTNYQEIDIEVLRTLSPQLRSLNWKCQAIVRDREIISVLPLNKKQLGLAIDLGTTKIAGYLLDLNSGHTLAADGVMNTQVSYGEDIISRITHIIHSPDDAIKIQNLAVEAINKLATDLCAVVDADVNEIVDAVVVGNTAMHHIFTGIPVKQLALAPFVPAVSTALDIKARDIGLQIARGASVHLLPNIAGFVGADHVAMLLATSADRKDTPVIALDIGTNTEVSLTAKDRIKAASCASGPAFEGAQIKHGMRAANGAIERVRITGTGIQYETINKTAPIGICGSGILDAVAQLYLAGIIDNSGRFDPNHPRVQEKDGQHEFILVNEKEGATGTPIVITQHDIRELQLAKAAIRTGIQVLLEANGLTDNDLKWVIIAGAFGTYIDVNSAITMGMLPPIPPERFKQVGNAAGMGAKLALISLQQRTEAQELAKKVGYIELASAPNFMNTFMQTNYLGKFRLVNGHREDIN